MLEKLVSWGRLLWDAGVKTDRNSQDINALQEQNQEFSEAFKLIVLQQEHDRQMNARRVESLEREIEGLRRELRDAHEKTELRLRLEISEQLRQLPPHRERVGGGPSDDFAGLLTCRHCHN